ncbi:hypothetical protein ABH897_002472 [Paenibacillus sp. RC73]
MAHKAERAGIFPFTVAGPRRIQTGFPFNSAPERTRGFHPAAPTSSAGYLM